MSDADACCVCGDPASLTVTVTDRWGRTIEDERCEVCAASVAVVGRADMEALARAPTTGRGNAVLDAAVLAYRLAWAYTEQERARWEPRLEEVNRLDAFHRTRVARENAITRAEWLREEAGHVLLRAAVGGVPFPAGEFKREVFGRCRNRLWLRALRAYEAAFDAAGGTW